MSRKKVLQAVKASGVKAAFGWYEPGNEPEKPYAVLNHVGENQLFADNDCYFETPRWQLDVITALDDVESVDKVKKSLKDAGIAYGDYGSDPKEGDGYVRTILRFES